MKTLIIGIQDITKTPAGPGLRITQHLNCIPNSTYVNVGNTPWNNITLSEKIKFMLTKYRPWHDVYATYHFEEYYLSLLRKIKCDRIIVSEFWAYPYFLALRKLKPDIYMILDLHNMESDLQEQLMLDSRGIARLLNKIRLRIIRRVEQELFDVADEVWVCSKYDYESYSKSDIFY